MSHRSQRDEGHWNPAGPGAGPWPRNPRPGSATFVPSSYDSLPGTGEAIVGPYASNVPAIAGPSHVVNSSTGYYETPMSGFIDSSTPTGSPAQYRQPPAASGRFWPDLQPSLLRANPGGPSLEASGKAPMPPAMVYPEDGKKPSGKSYSWDEGKSTPWMDPDFHAQDGSFAVPSSSGSNSGARVRTQRRPSNRDEFDGPHQYLEQPSPETIAQQERELPHLATNLFVDEQDSILSRVNDCLSKCAFDFVAKYQFPIPLEPDKRPVRAPGDREWTEWVYLLKRLATKRRIPARVLYNGQIKQLITVLENSLEMRHAAKHQSRPLKDDRNVLQLISAGLQVAKIFKDASAMEFLDELYTQAERMIQARKNTPGYMGH